MHNKRPLLCAFALTLALPVAFGQGGNNATSLSKPLTEQDLLSSGDPTGSTGSAARRPSLALNENLGRPGEGRKADDKSPRKDPTEILSREATFDPRTRQAVFLGDVKVNDPEVNIECDKLTAILKQGKGAPKADTSAAKGAAPAPPTAAPAPAKGKSGGLERAIAEGNVVIVQEKVDGDGTVSRSIGKARRAEFDSATGDVTLIGWPSVQQGINTFVATEEGTVMILNRERTMRANGTTKLTIKDSNIDKSLSPKP